VRGPNMGAGISIRNVSSVKIIAAEYARREACEDGCGRLLSLGLGDVYRRTLSISLMAVNASCLGIAHHLTERGKLVRNISELAHKVGALESRQRKLEKSFAVGLA